MLESLFRYGVDRPVITWFLGLAGIVLIIFNHYYLWALGLFVLFCSMTLIGHTLHGYRVVDHLIRRCDLRNARKILDVGTGRGYFLTHVTRAAGYIAFATGIEERSHDHLRQARRNARKAHVRNRVNVIHGDVRHLPFPEDYFNLVTVFGYRKSVINQSLVDLQAVCREILRVMKPNGQLILVGNRKDVTRIARYFSQQDHVKVRASLPGKWAAVKWGTLSAKKQF